MPHPYRPDEQAAAAAQTAATIAKDVLAPNADEVDRKARFPEESMAALARAGLWGLCIGRDSGGMGQGPRAFASAVEELSRACGSTSMIYVMHIVASQAAASSGTLGGKNDLLRAMATGKHLTTLAFSEKGSRSQFWAPVSTMVERDGGFVTSAQKSWVTSANKADSYVSSAQRPGAASPLESTVYLARRPSEAIRVQGGWDGLGLRGNDSAPVVLEGLKVARGDLISPMGEGAKTMLEVVLPWFCIGTAAMANGLCRAAVDATAGHLSQGAFEHTGQKLRDLPNLRARLAEMSVRTEQARALLGYMLDHVEQPSEVTPLFVLQARASSVQAAVDVTDLAMKTCGGAAFSRHLGLERIFRDARAGWVMAPTVDHLQDFVGRALTGLPLF